MNFWVALWSESLHADDSYMPWHGQSLFFDGGLHALVETIREDGILCYHWEITTMNTIIRRLLRGPQLAQQVFSNKAALLKPTPSSVDIVRGVYDLMDENVGA